MKTSPIITKDHLMIRVILSKLKSRFSLSKAKNVQKIRLISGIYGSKNRGARIVVGSVYGILIKKHWYI
jgi:hypothetical protein